MNEWSVRRRESYLHKTQQTQQTNIHALSAIRTRDLSYQAAREVPFRPHATGIDSVTTSRDKNVTFRRIFVSEKENFIRFRAPPAPDTEM